MTAEEAETVALRALAWIVADDDLCGVFLGATGASAGDLPGRARDPEFLAAVLAFLTMDDGWVAAFCSAEGLACDAPLAAQQALPGGTAPHWI